MIEFVEQLFSRLKDVWIAMTLNQKVITGAVVVASFIAVMYMTTLSEKMVKYTVLVAILSERNHI